mmetsp:Transcript_104255/g.238714  ORF Transcript_104255/g.238714 Transcript_104255/m.238714 type:complete len:145 (-) Transcript_104255:141-575(-)
MIRERWRKGAQLERPGGPETNVSASTPSAGEGAVSAQAAYPQRDLKGDSVGNDCWIFGPNSGLLCNSGFFGGRRSGSDDAWHPATKSDALVASLVFFAAALGRSFWTGAAALGWASVETRRRQQKQWKAGFLPHAFDNCFVGKN